LIYFISLDAQSTRPYYNGVFPERAPGASGSWVISDFLPESEIISPLKILDFPEKNAVLILSKHGHLYEVDLQSKEQRRILDIADRVQNQGEGGAVGFAIHPEFNQNTDNDYVYIYYRFRPNMDLFNAGYNRLAKFKWDPQTGLFDAASEEILIQQFDRHIWHNGGGMFFDNDGYLYLSVGDEGDPGRVDLSVSTQRLDRSLFSGLLRIDVDNDPTRSHPIRRQPIDPAEPPSGFLETYTQGYSIPNDNPWQSESGDILEEFYAIGLRAPYTAIYDELTDEIWIADVGSSLLEEINRIEKGGNYQWPYMEGDEPSETFDKPEPLIGTEYDPTFFYDRDLGSAVIGGGRYRGSLFPSLDGQYILGDYISNKLMRIDLEQETKPNVIVDDVRSFGHDLPDQSGLAAVNILKNGRILISMISASDFTRVGKIFELSNNERIPDPAEKLSDLGVFEDLETLTIHDAFIPYTLNSPLWSDGALKKRWLFVPTDGDRDQEDEQIVFKERDEWSFPEGSVFVKHFELNTDRTDPGVMRRLETRFFIIGDNNQAYGLTYKWNDDGTEAFLQSSGSKETIDITEGDLIIDEQIWDYPSRSNCMSCHNSQAKFVLGLNTHQINKEITHPLTGENMNQLNYFSSLGLFNRSLASPDRYLRSYGLDDERGSLEERVFSYLSANCGFCHRQNGFVSTTFMDLSYQALTDSPRSLHRFPTTSRASTTDALVEPGNHLSSELWLRDASREQNQMPPLATNMVDDDYVDLLAEWINGLSLDTLQGEEITFGPNPSRGLFRLDTGSEWDDVKTISVYNIQGKMVRELTTTGSFSAVQIQDLGTGIFIFKITDGIREYMEKILLLNE